VEAPGDFGVGLVLRDEGKNLLFPLGQLGEGVERRTGSGRSEVVDQSFRDDGPKIASPVATARIARRISALSAPLSR